MPLGRSRAVCLCLSLALALARMASSQTPPNSSSATPGWPTYGGDAGGMRYSSAVQITQQNVAHLKPAWVFHTGALDQPEARRNEASFEATPVLSQRTLFFTSPFDVAFAIDAVTGKQLWKFDPQLSPLPKGMIIPHAV